MSLARLSSLRAQRALWSWGFEMGRESHIEPFPLEEIKTPLYGYEVIPDHYWLVKDGMYFRSKRGGAPQCNRDKKIVEMIYGSLLKEGYQCLHLPVAYIKRDKYDY